MAIRSNQTRSQLLLVALCLLILTALSFFVVIVMPDLGVHADGPHSGKWAGVFHNKNYLGRAMVLACISLMLVGLYWFRAALIGLTVIFLWKDLVTWLPEQTY